MNQIALSTKVDTSKKRQSLNEAHAKKRRTYQRNEVLNKVLIFYEKKVMFFISLNNYLKKKVL